MSGVYCYIQRTSGGSAIRGLRLVDRRQAREWTPGLTDAARSGPEAEQENTLAAARWIAQQLAAANGSPKSRWLTLCLDLDGGRCAWLSPVSAEHEAVKSAAVAASVGGSATGDEHSSGPGMGAAWSSEFGEVGLDLSVQGLDPLPSENAKTTAPRSRLAALAIPDVPVRVLLDELDRLGVEVRAVTTLWHALVDAWDPSRAEALSGGVLGKNGAGPQDKVVASSEPASAVVMLDPLGRLAWAWSREGRLIAAGVQRLRTLEVAKAPPAPPASPTMDETALSGARRLPDIGEQAAGEASRMLEVSRFDTGRIVSEWLAWSAQLGAAPSRIVCIGPGQLVATGLADAPGLAAVGQTLAVGWPGAAAAAIEEDDPVLATLTRLAGSDADPVDAEASGADGGQLLMDLSSRPGRLSRALHWWLAAMGVAVAAALCVVAWQLQRGVNATRDTAQAAVKQRAEIFKSVDKTFPKLGTSQDPVAMLKLGLVELRKNRDDVTPEFPVLAALERVVAAANPIGALKLKTFSASGIPGGVSADFVASDAEPGAKLLDALRKDNPPFPSGVRISWEGDTLNTTVPVYQMPDPQRIFKLRGTWIEPKKGEKLPGATPGAAAPKPDSAEPPAGAKPVKGSAPEAPAKHDAPAEAPAEKAEPLIPDPARPDPARPEPAKEGQ